jgi:phosphate butyryltransferase
MKINRLVDLLKLKNNKRMKLVVIASHDKEVLQSVKGCYDYGLIEPILIGDLKKTKKLAEELNISIENYYSIDEKDLEKAAEIGVKLISSGNADFIMKGLIDTSILLKALLNKEWGLRTESLLSHVMIYDIENYHKLLYLTDGGMNINPTLEDKVKIIENAGMVTRSLGNKVTNVAILAAKEKVDLKMISTVHADQLKDKYLIGEFSQGLVIDGPMALDIAISNEAAKIKNYISPVAGDADVLVVPNIEMGNGIGKSITYFANGKSAGIIMGAKVPIVLTSRADDHITKVFSIALGSLISTNIIKEAENL